MNYLIARKSESEIQYFIKEHPYSYATQIAEFLNADKKYVRELVRIYKLNNGLKKVNVIETRKFIDYLKRQNKSKSSLNQV